METTSDGGRATTTSGAPGSGTEGRTVAERDIETTTRVGGQDEEEKRTPTRGTRGPPDPKEMSDVVTAGVTSVSRL